MNQVTVKVDTPSKVTRKLTITVPAQAIEERFQREINQVQKKAKLKGFRPGMAPISVIKQYYGADVRHQVLHDLIDDSYRWAVKEQQIRPVGMPQIDTPGTHEHHIDIGEDLTYTATVEIFPEVELKSYTGLSVKRQKVEVADADVDAVIANLRDSQAQLEPYPDDHAAKTGDFVDFTFKGGVVTDQGVEERPGMSGTRVVQIGANELIPGFEDHLIGLKKSESKTFRIEFPKEYSEDLGGKTAEFSATVNGIKEKKLPNLDDDFAKSFQAETLLELKVKARESVESRKKRESEEQLRSELLQALVEKNPFDVPEALIQAQMQSLMQEFAENLKSQGFNEQMVQNALASEQASVRTRAEGQVRAGLLLDAVSKKEGITATQEKIDAEIARMAKAMQMEESKLKDYYMNNAERRRDLEYRVREDQTVQFLISKAKIKE